MNFEARIGIGGDPTRPERPQVNERLHVVFIQPVRDEVVKALELPPYPEWILAATGLQPGELEVVRALDTTHFPRLDDVDGIISGGAPKIAPEDLPRIRGIRDYLREGERIGIPELNICLSNNIMVENHGGEVRRRPEGLNSGIETIRLTDAGRKHPLMRGLPDEIEVFKSHKRMVAALPPSRPDSPVSVLATGLSGRYEATAIGTSVGVSWHPEMTTSIIRRVAVLDRPNLKDPSDAAFRSLLRSISSRGSLAEQHGRIMGRNFVRNIVAPRRLVRR